MFPLSTLGWFGFAAVLSAMLVYALIPLAVRLGLIDHPAGRKQHAVSTPLVGGLAIFLSLALAHAVFGSLREQSASLIIALSITLFVGLADDAREITHRSKFFAQFIAASIIVSGTNVHVAHLGDLLGVGDLLLEKWSYLVTVIAIIGLMNAINMIDGLDGLAGTQVLIPLLAYSGIAVVLGDLSLTRDLLLLAGAIAGFLCFNLRTPWRERARVFMGDTGGLILGLLLAWYSIRLAGNANAYLKPISAVWIVALPLLDMGAVMVLRLRQRRSPFAADRQHLHYILRDGGFSAKQVVMLLAVCALGFALLALGAQWLGLPEWMMFVGFLALLLAYVGLLSRPEYARRLAAVMLKPAA